MKKLYKIYLFLVTVLILGACESEFLDDKSISNQVIPRSISDYEGVVDEKFVLNQNSPMNLAMIAGEEFTISDEVYTAMSGTYSVEQGAYTWEFDVLKDKESKDWNFAFQRIMYANLALDIRKIKEANSRSEQVNNVVGIAKFHHAWNYYQLLLQFGEPWSAEIKGKVCTIPYRNDYDVESMVEVLSYEKLYDRLINSLLESVKLLPAVQPAKTRPNKAAGYLLLAKIYLQMQDFENADDCVNKCLELNPNIVDFNDLSSGYQFAFQSDLGYSNPAVLFYQITNSIRPLANARMNVEPDLLALYDQHDIRKQAFFQSGTGGRTTYRGSYHGGINNFFVGLTVDEAYLIRAETNLRKGKVDQALSDLNFLRKNRIKKAYFETYNNHNRDELMSMIITERRRELCFRGNRWEYLRRLNVEGAFSTDLTREIGNQTYRLDAADKSWKWGVPQLY